MGNLEFIVHLFVVCMLVTLYIISCADVCACTPTEKYDVSREGANRLLRPHSTIFEHCDGGPGPHKSGALEIFELG